MEMKVGGTVPRGQHRNTIEGDMEVRLKREKSMVDLVRLFY